MWGRFVSRDIIIGDNITIGENNGFPYAANNPLVMGDASGYVTMNIIYDSRPDASEGGKGFPNQAEWYRSVYEKSVDQINMLGFITIEDFIDVWNTMPDAEYLIIIAHGAEGTLDCAGERLGVSTKVGNSMPVRYVSSSLNRNTSITMTLLLTCNGATPNYAGISLADIIAYKTDSPVVAVKNGKVNYWNGKGPAYSINEHFPYIIDLARWTSTFPNKIVKEVEMIEKKAKKRITNRNNNFYAVAMQ